MKFRELSDFAMPVRTTVGPAPVTAPLSPRHRAPVRVMRPGAFDYRDIPSRYADERVAYKSSIILECKDQRG